MPTHTLSIPVAPPFDLQLALHGHSARPGIRRAAWRRADAWWLLLGVRLPDPSQRHLAMEWCGLDDASGCVAAANPPTHPTVLRRGPRAHGAVQRRPAQRRMAAGASLGSGGGEPRHRLPRHVRGATPARAWAASSGQPVVRPAGVGDGTQRLHGSRPCQQPAERTHRRRLHSADRPTDAVVGPRRCTRSARVQPTAPERAGAAWRHLVRADRRARPRRCVRRRAGRQPRAAHRHRPPNVA